MPDKCRDVLLRGAEHSADVAPCRIGLHHWRPRSTGPCFPIFVAKCETHGHAFTIYPASHIPYGRVAVAPVEIDGETLLIEPPPEAPAAAEVEPEPAVATATGHAPAAPGHVVAASSSPVWELSLFKAAFDASVGFPWPRDHERGSSEAGSPLWWQTMRRRMVRGAELFGLNAAQGDVERDRRAEVLGVPALRLRDAARQWREATGYRTRGAAVAFVVGELPRGGCVLDRILVAGALSELWGRPFRWDHRAGRVRDLLTERYWPP